MVDVQDLVVRMRPEGTDETQRELDQTAGSFEETADRSEESALELENFSRKFTGALAVAGAALGGITAGFLSRVPAVQEAAVGFGAVIDQLAFKFDEEFGPAIRDGTDALFELSEEIRNAESFSEGLTLTAEFVIDNADEVEQTVQNALAGVQDLTIEVSVNVAELIAEETFKNAGEASAQDFLDGFSSLLRSTGLSTLTSLFQELFERAAGAVFGEQGRQIIEERGIVGTARSGVREATGGSGGGGGGDGGLLRRIAGLAIQGSPTNVKLNLDGKQVAESEDRFAADGALRRGLL